MWKCSTEIDVNFEIVYMIFKHFGKFSVTGPLVSDVSKDCILFSGSSTLRNVSV